MQPAPAQLSLVYQRSLFLQALAAMQAAPWTDPESYFQLSGIHGLPYTAYEGAINPLSPYVPGQIFEINGRRLGRHGGEAPLPRRRGRGGLAT